MIEVRQNPVNLSKGRKKYSFFFSNGERKKKKSLFSLCALHLSPVRHFSSSPHPNREFFFLFFVVENWVRPVMFLKFSPANALSPPPTSPHTKEIWNGKNYLVCDFETKIGIETLLVSRHLILFDRQVSFFRFFFLSLFNFLYFNFHVFFFDVVLFPFFF